jgi:hypothetical protein
MPTTALRFLGKRHSVSMENQESAAGAHLAPRGARQSAAVQQQIPKVLRQTRK